LPASASVAAPLRGAKLHAPAAERNADALCGMLRTHAPIRGSALEIASGTGQHVVAFAAALPDLHWHPTEIDQERRDSIDAYVADAALPNVAPARTLDATAPGWGKVNRPHDLILLINLLHLISMSEVTVLITEAATALAPGGALILYGPFKRSGQLTSDGDLRFDAELRSTDASLGYKDDLDITRLLSDVGLNDPAILAMPANNLAFIARKPAL
jgi:cyclopropane fatty-acyl-phospholipid synthase-like methyltransferase